MNLQAELDQRMQELSFAQAQIEAIFENSPFGIGTASLDGTILSANPALARIFGYEEKEVLQINVNDFSQIRLFATRLCRICCVSGLLKCRDCNCSARTGRLYMST